MNKQPEQIPEKDLLERLKKKIAPVVLKKVEAFNEKSSAEESREQMDNIKETSRILREQIEKNTTLLNETFQETAVVTKKEENNADKDENETDPTGKKNEMKGIIDELVSLEKKMDGESTRKRMNLMENLLEKNLENTLSIILEMLHCLLEKKRMGIETDGTKKCEEKIVQIINILAQITMKHSRIKDIQLNQKNSPIEQSYKNFPELLKKFRTSDNFSDGINTLIQALHIDNRMSRYQLSRQILPEMAIHCDDELIKHRKDKEIGEFVSIALNLACEAMESKEMQKKPTTTKEKAALAFITKFIPRKK